MRHKSGWVKVFRGDGDHWLDQEWLLKSFWRQLLVMANYKPSRIRSGKDFVELVAGSIVTSSSELSGITGLGRKVVRNYILSLKNDNMIDVKTTKQGTIITICNWNKYQNQNNEEGQPSSEEQANDGPTMGQRWANDGPLSEEEKKERKKEVNTSIAFQAPPEPSVHGNDSSLVKIDTFRAKIDYEAFVATWNSYRKTLAACTKLTDSRKKKIKDRLKENPDLGYWAQTVERLANSKFACEGSWANFDWLVANDTNHVKAAEGKYDDKTKGSKLTSADFDYIFSSSKQSGSPQ